MELFTFTPGTHEPVDAFNKRLAEFSATQEVTGVRASTIGSTLVLSLTLADDLPAPKLLRPFIVIVPKDGMPALETSLTSLLDQIKAEDKPATKKGEEDIMSVPLEVRCYDAPHEETGQAGYAVFLIGVGELDFDNG